MTDHELRSDIILVSCALLEQYVFSRSVGSPVLITEHIKSVQERYKTYGQQKLKQRKIT